MKRTESPHPSTARLEQAYQAVKKEDPTPTRMGLWLNVSSGRYGNWGRRGIPHAVAMQVEQEHEVSAAWVLTGKGEMLIATSRKRSKDGVMLGPEPDAEAQKLVIRAELGMPRVEAYKSLHTILKTLGIHDNVETLIVGQIKHAEKLAKLQAEELEQIKAKSRHRATA